MVWFALDVSLRVRPFPGRSETAKERLGWQKLSKFLQDLGDRQLISDDHQNVAW